MSLISVLVGLVVGFTQPGKWALLAASATWVLTTVYLLLAAGEDASDEMTAGFWVIQVGILLLALAVAWGAARVRSLRRR